MGIDALAADGHKWLMGPEGCGVLYIRRSRQDQVFPAEFGWTNVAAYEDYASRDLTLRTDAGRYECGTLNTIGCFGLRAAIEFVLRTGVAAIGGAVLGRAEQLARGVASRGFELIRPWDRAAGAGIVSFRRPGVDARLTVRDLKEAGIIAAPRQGWARVSPHFYQTADEMDRVLAALG
jgi:selenocysteine lyase/cysteine desulfurase